MAPEHPEWKSSEPYKSVLAGDMKGLAAAGEKGVVEILAATHAGMTLMNSTESSVRGWTPLVIRFRSGRIPR